MPSVSDLNYSPIMASPSDSTELVNGNILGIPDILDPYLEKALSSRSITGTPVSLFNHASSSNNNVTRPDLVATLPTLRRDAKNHILLFPGSFNPPHQGHLATIRYFYERRDQLGIVTMFIFADPDEIIRTKEKEWGDIILPQELRNKMFAQVPELSQLVASRWLYLLVGDMEGHIQVLRTMTDLISEAGFDVKLVGFLGGDKLSIRSPPHLPPGDLTIWGPVDEFLIMNARRPVDFYDAGQDTKDRSPHNLPGCTEWERYVSDNSLAAEQEQNVGVLWLCKALTVPREPHIQFRASQSSASNGISSTNIRRIMSETPVEDLYDRLKDQVLSVELLVEWLQRSRAHELAKQKDAP
jgi:hypothetical protein